MPGDHHPGRLVNDDQMRVLEMDVEGDRLRRRLRVFRLGQRHDNAGTDHRTLRRVAQDAARSAGDAPVEDQLFQSAARQFGEQALQGAVEPHAAVFRGDAEFDPLSFTTGRLRRIGSLRHFRHLRPRATSLRA